MANYIVKFKNFEVWADRGEKWGNKYRFKVYIKNLTTGQVADFYFYDTTNNYKRGKRELKDKDLEETLYYLRLDLKALELDYERFKKMFAKDDEEAKKLLEKTKEEAEKMRKIGITAEILTEFLRSRGYCFAFI